MPEILRRLRAAIAARPGWSVAALVLGLAGLVLPFWDGSIQPQVAAWRAQPGVHDLLELLRPFGRGEVAVLIALAVGASGRWRLSGQLLVAVAICALVTWLCRLGDTSIAFALLPLLARTWSQRAGAIALAVGVGWSRTVFGDHGPAEVCAGAAVGLLSGVVAARLWPERPWGLLTDRRAWLVLAGVVWLAAVVWAVTSPTVDWLRTFLLVWGPALAGWAAWPWLRHRLRTGWLPPTWAVAAGLALLLAALASTSTLWDRDEPRNALAALEMVASGDWLVPTFNGEPRLHKPILPYWLMTAALATGLPSDVACRLPAVLCMALAVWLLGGTVRRLVPGDRRLAVVAMVALAGSPLVLVSGSAATTDAALLLGISATMWVLVRTLLDGPHWWHVPAAGAAIGWALLAKGPMALLVPIATIAALACLRWLPAARALVTWRTWVVLTAAVAIGCGLALAWFMPADRSLDGAMWREMIGDHVVRRALEARESHGGKLWYYLPVLVAGFIAWLPAQAVALRRSAQGGATTLILLAWAVPVLVVVSLVQTKLPHYLLPMLWPVAVLVAAAVPGTGDARWWIWGRRVQAAVLGLVVVALLAAAPVAALGQTLGLFALPLPLAPLVAPACAAGLAFWLLLHLVRGHRERFAGAAGWGMAVLALTLAANVWRLEAYKPAPRLAAVILATVEPGVPITTCGFDEPSLYFYLGPDRGLITTRHGGKGLRAWAELPGPGVMVATAQRLREAEALGDAPLPLRELHRMPGYNYSNGKAVELVLLAR